MNELIKSDRLALIFEEAEKIEIHKRNQFILSRVCKYVFELEKESKSIKEDIENLRKRYVNILSKKL